MSDAHLTLVPATGDHLADRSDDDLMLLASAGAREAFAALLDRHGARVLGFCVRMLGDPARAEDVAQETWLEGWARRRAYRPDGRLVCYLYSIARSRRIPRVGIAPIPGGAMAGVGFDI